MNGMMNGRIEAIKERSSLRAYADAHLEKCGKTYVCPTCGSGKGENHTPAFCIDPNGRRWKCFSCGAGGDVIDLAQTVGGGSLNDALAELERFAGIDAPAAPTDTGRAPVKKSDGPTADYEDGRRAEAERLEASRAAMTEGCPGARYLMGRGFTFDEIKRFGIGWDGVRGCVMLPFGDAAPWYHVDRFVSTGGKRHGKPRAAEVGPQPAYHPEVLQGGRESVVFVVEAALDALAVEACGHAAVALCSTSSTATTKAIREAGFEGVLILMLDNDEAGREGADRMARELDGFRLYRAQPSVWKDACEALQRDRAALASYLAEQESKARAEASPVAEVPEIPERVGALRTFAPSFAAGDILSGIDAETPTPTGIGAVDKALCGGLRRGLYALGAASSFGKTTLMVQFADHIAAHGRPVLFVTIEQSTQEIVTKTLTRKLHERGFDVDGFQLNDAGAREGWTDAAQDAFFEAVTEYERESELMCIAEATLQPSVSDVRRLAEAVATRHADRQPPVVFIDYLQLLAPLNDRDSDKQAVDKNVMALRQLARDLKTTVFVTSSLNRASYAGAVSMASFKESGAVEYGSDFLSGLQPQDLESRLEKCETDAEARAKAARIYKQTKAADVRAIEFVILKYRNGPIAERPVRLWFDAKGCRLMDEPPRRGQAAIGA